MMGLVVDLAEARQRRHERQRQESDAPEWAQDIQHCCLYAQMLKAEHDAETARLRFEKHRDGISAWWEAPSDVQDRVHANNREWERYRALMQHIAALPAQTRQQAQMKRNTIGSLWLRPNRDEWYARLRAGCEQDDHLFPASAKLARTSRS